MCCHPAFSLNDLFLSVNHIRENKEDIIERLAIKNFKDAADLINKTMELDDERKKTQNELDSLLAHQNLLAKEIGELFKTGKFKE